MINKTVNWINERVKQMNASNNYIQVNERVKCVNKRANYNNKRLKQMNERVNIYAAANHGV